MFSLGAIPFLIPREPASYKGKTEGNPDFPHFKRASFDTPTFRGLQVARAPSTLHLDAGLLDPPLKTVGGAASHTQFEEGAAAVWPR